MGKERCRKAVTPVAFFMCLGPFHPGILINLGGVSIQWRGNGSKIGATFFFEIPFAGTLFLKNASLAGFDKLRPCLVPKIFRISVL